MLCLTRHSSLRHRGMLLLLQVALQIVGLCLDRAHAHFAANLLVGDFVVRANFEIIRQGSLGRLLIALLGLRTFAFSLPSLRGRGGDSPKCG